MHKINDNFWEDFGLVSRVYCGTIQKKDGEKFFCRYIRSGVEIILWGDEAEQFRDCWAQLNKATDSLYKEGA